MSDIYIAGTAAVIGPDDCLVITLPQNIDRRSNDEYVTNLEEALKDHPLAGRVLIVGNAQVAVVKGEDMPSRKPAHPPTSESGVSKGPDGRR